jgi:toxin ParE1/3/4
MLARVVWADRANDDLRAILDFIATDSPNAAARYIAGLESACSRLADFPALGRRYDEFTRVLVYRNHLAFYENDIATGTVTILTVLDGRRDLERLLDR